MDTIPDAASAGNGPPPQVHLFELSVCVATLPLFAHEARLQSFDSAPDKIFFAMLDIANAAMEALTASVKMAEAEPLLSVLRDKCFQVIHWHKLDEDHLYSEGDEVHRARSLTPQGHSRYVKLLYDLDTAVRALRRLWDVPARRRDTIDLGLTLGETFAIILAGQNGIRDHELEYRIGHLKKLLSPFDKALQEHVGGALVLAQGVDVKRTEQNRQLWQAMMRIRDEVNTNHRQQDPLRILVQRVGFDPATLVSLLNFGKLKCLQAQKDLQAAPAIKDRLKIAMRRAVKRNEEEVPKLVESGTFAEKNLPSEAAQYRYCDLNAFWERKNMVV